MKLHGKIIKTYPKERIVVIKNSFEYIYLYLQRKDFKEFGPYFYDKPYLFIEVFELKKKVNKFVVYEVKSFSRIVIPKRKKRLVFYDIGTIQEGVKSVINKKGNKMFLDLEFTMPSYYQTTPHFSEIIQYGLIIEDSFSNIVYEDSQLVKPTKTYNLNGRTLKFLSLKKEDFDKAITYKEFYNIIKMLLKTFRPKIYVWGRSDILALEQSFKINKVKPLNIRSEHVNLMQIIKNYYNQKDELGLFQTYKVFTEQDYIEQKHDAFEDAFITREIYNMFKNKINKI